MTRYKDKQIVCLDDPHRAEPLSPRETRQLMLTGMKWALGYAVGLMLALALFVLFCVKVWFV